MTRVGQRTVEPVPSGRHRRPVRRRGLARIASSAGAISMSQAVTAGASLVLQIIAARELGLVGYGRFALCIAFLVTATALYTGYVGDTLTVMDRHDPAIRTALVSSALVGLALAFATSTGVIIVLRLGAWPTAILFGAVVVAWLLEETGRRLLLVRLQYWRLVGNDSTYALVTLLVVIVAAVAGARPTLGTLLVAMLAGCVSAIALALVQLPSHEYRRLSPGLAGARTVGSFALWRSLQSTLRPTQLFGARVLLQQLVTIAAVGVVEAGRLVVAPIQTLLNGASAFLLSSGAAAARDDPHGRRRTGAVAAVLVVLTLVCGGVAALLSHPLGRLMAGRDVSHLLVLGWAAYLAMWAASLPFTAELAVRALSWPVFVARLAETVTGLGLVAAALGSDFSPELVPWLLAAPALVNTWYVRRLVVRARAAAA